MLRILKFAVAALVVFLIIVEVVPWVRSRVEGITEGKIVGRPDPLSGSDAAACVYLTDEINDAVASAVRIVKPPPETSNNWIESSYVFKQRLSEADDACTCPGGGCATARRAIAEIDSLVDDVDRMISGELSGAVSLANRQERIEALLDQARLEAR